MGLGSSHGRRRLRLLALATGALAVVTAGMATPAWTSPAGRLYSPSSPVNQPIPADPPIDPGSAGMVQGLVEQIKAKGLALALRGYAVPAYFPRPGIPRADVSLTASWAAAPVLAGVPIPAGARPDPESDGQMAILDRQSGCEFDLWQARRGADGRWSAAWGNTTLLAGDGTFPLGNSARGSGFALLAGLIWPDELRAGHVYHALMFASPYTAAGDPVAPATESDGRTPSDDPRAMPMGARVQLNPDLDLDTLGLTPAEKTVAQALQTYGMYLGDTSGNVSLFAVSPLGYGSDPYAGLLPGDKYPILAKIPADQFRVLELGPRRQVDQDVSGLGCRPARPRRRPGPSIARRCHRTRVRSVRVRGRPVRRGVRIPCPPRRATP